MKKILVLFLGVCWLSGQSAAFEFSLKASGGWAWVGGGDLNESIAGWKRYYQDRQSPSFSASYGLKEMHGCLEGSAEAVAHLSSCWSASVAVGLIEQRRNGQIRTRLAVQQTDAIFPSGSATVDLEETTDQYPAFSLETIPVTLTITYSLRLGEKSWLDLGGGAGAYWSKLVYQEDYEYAFDYTEEKLTPGASIQYVDRFSSSGKYKEETKSRGFGLHGRVGLNLKLSASIFLTAELFGRWVEFKSWEGEKTDAYEWSQTWGLWGAFSERGEEEETVAGRLWRVDLHGSETGGSYPRLIFSDVQPSSSSYLSVKPARLNLSGVGLRIGIGLRLGKRK
jgi:hypothetical protein